MTALLVSLMVFLGPAGSAEARAGAAAAADTVALPDSSALADSSGSRVPGDSTASTGRGPAPPDTAPAPGASVLADTARARGGVDYLWVLRGALVDPAKLDHIVERAKAIGARGLLVQVVGRGDAFYRSDILPRSEALGGSGAPPDYDPLAEILERAHRSGLEVHAWVNCMLVWSARSRPRDPRHVLNAHPEWVAAIKGGRPLSWLKPRERQRLAIEGVYLNPAHPRVRTWIASIAQEIARRYPVDGIHLDYIRQPDVAVGYDPTTRARFALQTGVDPERRDRLPAPQRAAVDPEWLAFQREQVTAVVREVRASVCAARPGLPISAAVVADTVRAVRSTAQPVQKWVQAGLP